MYQRRGAFHGQKKEASENEVSVVLYLQENITYGVLILLKKCCGFIVEILKTVSTRCSEIGSRRSKWVRISGIVVIE